MLGSLPAAPTCCPISKRVSTRPDCLVDVTRIPELNSIEIDNGWATIGAAVTFVVLREQPYFVSHVHALVDAAGSVGALAIQCSATWVGNLVQAMPAADGAIIAIALDCRGARGGSRQARAGCQSPTLYAGPGRSRIDSTRQVVTHLRFPIPTAAWGTAWRRAGRRPSLILPTLNCAVKVVLEANGTESDRIAAAAIAMGPVGPCPIRAHDAEAFLVGRKPDAECLPKLPIWRFATPTREPASCAPRASIAWRCCQCWSRRRSRWPLRARQDRSC